ncbi:GntR family transcriptional regulator [Yersinia intermedia]|uniref:GntR family transcriptional regulator n=1 Tax=Yersinia intermedia TaxID=631 RepID=UPI000B67F1FC|nr:GntR family transcriptional regulator [Yersinia intermedia]MCW8112796.1 GntR family transcriptional regulator [Yersinia intermedia]MDA5481874.1 GntR family transcriptional regulator [Yersinia intermedia]MDA5516522.1 GntR family transcriptional regulator [Yersinia intermedia]OWF92317.1 transcriptional regulator [Yersinia intermedia]
MFESDGLPLYLRIKGIILQRIITFTYDDKLPGELLLADEFKVARGTIKQAIDSLVSIGMLYREQGKGTFINRDALHKYYTDLPDVLVTFNAAMPVEVEILSLLSIMANQELADRMQLDLGSQLMRLERLFIQGEKVLGHSITYLNGRVYNDLSHVDEVSPLYAQLRETFGYSPTKATERYMPVLCDAKLAGLLNIDQGSALFRIERTASNLDDVVLEFSITNTQDATLSLQIVANQSVVNQQWNCTVSKAR